MDGNGGSRAELGLTGTSGPPNPVGTYRASRLLHGGARWFLHLEAVPGEVGPGGLDRYDFFVVRQDGAVRLRLTSDPAIAYSYKCEWAADEDADGVTIGVLAARWTGTSSTDTVIPGTCGLYLARLDFDASGNPIGLEAEPALATPLPARGQPGREFPDVFGFFAWSPDMARIAFNRDSDRTNIWIADAGSGALALLGAGEGPDWSPDGSKIVCRRYVDGSKPSSVIETLRPDGTGRTILVSVNLRKTPGSSQYVQLPQWSPDGAYVAYNYTVDGHSLNVAYWIYRVAADGTGVTNLTPEVRLPASDGGFVGAWLRTWR
jgi:hypothetical protein